ncbi:hypothetical protein GBAR_LOCUS12581 [Geodia barretti]|uniref:Uncharacterized protein n=1 Tax=Geodia barretti TaxID=519541 RepID=A0AA35S1D9_GEOBA|nr:hypothetical protein GBAR_LOCUS12581 [Geodia barretti]
MTPLPILVCSGRTRYHMYWCGVLETICCSIPKIGVFQGL